MSATSVALPVEDDAVDQIEVELARRDFAEFVSFTKPDYLRGWWSEELCRELDQFLQDVADKKSPRLIIQAPPRHGKSELASRRLPAYALGRFPDFEIIAASYSNALAARMNRDVQRIIDSPIYREVFETQIPSRNVRNDSKGKLRNSEIFEVVDGDGSYRSAGVGVGIGGMGCQVLIIDDPVKDAADANSPTKRKAVWEWYTSTARARVEPGGGVLVITTRWNVDDLAGRMIAGSDTGEGETFRVVSYSAVAEEDEANRNEGEPLVPARYDSDALAALKKAVGSYNWSALYQQRPTVEGGGVFKAEWWSYYDPTALPRFKHRMIYADTAQKTGERNDFSVLQVWALGYDGRIYLLDQIRGKWEAPELKRRTIAFWKKWNEPTRDRVRTRGLGIEDKSSGTGLIQEIQADGGIPVRAIQRNVDKSVRADDGAPQIEAGNVVLPKPESAPAWLSDYLSEFEDFTKDGSHAHDDQIDPTLDAIAELLGSSRDLYSGAVS